MKKTNLIIILSILCAASVVGMVLALCFGRPRADFTPPPFESNAQTGAPLVPEMRGYQELNVGIFRVFLCGEVCLEDDAADVWFTNPAENHVWLKLRILDAEGVVLGQTGILRPGEHVRQVALSEPVAVDTPIVLKVMAYEPETYHGAGALELHTVIAAE